MLKSTRSPAVASAAMARADTTKTKIVAAALESLHEEGILGASARAIARRGGFNQALIFYHFGSVDDLLLAAVDELSARRAEKYEERLEQVSSLAGLVAEAGRLHGEDMDDGHMTVLSQMLAAAATDPGLRGPLRKRFEPWMEIVERTVVRALADSPYGQLVPAKDLAFGITALYVGLELLLNLEDDESTAERDMFGTFERLATVLESILQTLPVPERATPTDAKPARTRRSSTARG
jgi:AcrR family transcriptional regulator